MNLAHSSSQLNEVEWFLQVWWEAVTNGDNPTNFQIITFHKIL